MANCVPQSSGLAGELESRTGRAETESALRPTTRSSGSPPTSPRCTRAASRFRFRSPPHQTRRVSQANWVGTSAFFIERARRCGVSARSWPTSRPSTTTSLATGTPMPRCGLPRWIPTTTPTRAPAHSGTTSAPKAVRVTHGNIQANTESIVEYLGLAAGRPHARRPALLVLLRCVAAAYPPPRSGQRRPCATRSRFRRRSSTPSSKHVARVRRRAVDLSAPPAGQLVADPTAADLAPPAAGGRQARTLARRRARGCPARRACLRDVRPDRGDGPAVVPAARGSRAAPRVCRTRHSRVCGCGSSTRTTAT